MNIISKILDAIAIIILIAAIIAFGWLLFFIYTILSIFVDFHWWEFGILLLIVAFVFWRLGRYI